MSEEHLLYDARDGVVTITFNRPRVMNALLSQTAIDLPAFLERAAAEPDIRALILTGAGRKAFSAGADLSDINPASMEESWNRMMLHIARFPRPTIAAIDGVAVGAGLSIALACDMRLAGEGSRLGAVFVRRGLMPDTGVTYLLPRLVGPDHALKLLLTGRLAEAAEALALGMVTEVVPAGEALERARALAREIAANAPLPVGFTHGLLHGRFAREFEEGLATEFPFVATCLETADAEEGGRAFLEKRAPQWSGR